MILLPNRISCELQEETTTISLNNRTIMIYKMKIFLKIKMAHSKLKILKLDKNRIYIQ